MFADRSLASLVPAARAVLRTIPGRRLRPSRHRPSARPADPHRRRARRAGGRIQCGVGRRLRDDRKLVCEHELITFVLGVGPDALLP